MPTDINLNGQVCGIAKLQTGFIKPNQGIFIWQSDSENYLLKNTPFTTPVINDLGHVAFTEDKTGWFSNQKQGCIWDAKDGVKSLEMPKEWTDCYVRDINNLGDILLMDKPVKLCKCNPHALITIHRNQEFSSFIFSDIQQGDKLNHSGQVLGTAFHYIGLKEISYPIVIDPSTGFIHMIPFNDTAWVYDMNNQGQVVGQFYDESKKLWVGFLWDIHNSIEVFEDFLPFALNNNGQIIGLNSKYQSILWENGQGKNIELLCEPEPGSQIKWEKILKLTGINDKGQIIGFGKSNHQIHGFVLNPVED